MHPSERVRIVIETARAVPASALLDPASNLEMARILGELAQTLR